MMTLPKRMHEVAQPIFTTEVYLFYEDKVLMFKRSENKKKFPGFWSIPGGHIDEGEDPLAAAIREVKEETGINLKPEEMKLKVVAMHHHLDRQEMYVAFSFIAQVDREFTVTNSSEEGTAHWLARSEANALQNVFPPIKYYFEHVLNNRPGIIFNHSQWENSQLIKVLSETIESS